jgi:hypothetical protein
MPVADGAATTTSRKRVPRPATGKTAVLIAIESVDRFITMPQLPDRIPE